MTSANHPTAEDTLQDALDQAASNRRQERDVRRLRLARASGVAARAGDTFMPRAYTEFWKALAAEINDRDDIEHSPAASVEGAAVMVACVADAADRLSAVHLALMAGCKPDGAERRRLLVDDMASEFKRILTMHIEGRVPLDVLMDEERAAEAPADATADFANMFREAMARMKADVDQSPPKPDPMREAMDQRMRGMVAAAERAPKPERIYAGEEIKAMRTDPPSDVHPRAEETSPAPEPAEAPDAGKANPMPRTTAFAQGALDALAAEQAKPKPRVYRFDESGEFPAAPQRIETEGERG